MRKRQAGKLDMYDLVILFFTKYDTELNAFAPLTPQRAALLLKLIAIKAALDQQSYTSKGKTLSKEALKQVAISLVFPLAQLACGWAITTGDLDAEQIFDIEEDAFNVKQDDFVILVDNLLETLTAKLTDLATYEITALKITAAEDAKLAYVVAKEKPKQQKASKKNITISLPKLFKEADKILVVCDKLIPGRFKNTAPDMVSEYFFDRKLFIAGTRHTNLKIHVYGDEEHTTHVADAVFSIISLNRSDITDINGDGELIQFRGGSYSLNIKAVGFNDQDIPFSIKSGKVLELDITMVPNIITGNALSHLGKPAAGYNVNILDTPVSTTTDAFGNFELAEVPEGNGFVEITNEEGEKLKKPYSFVQGQNLKIDFTF